MYSENIVSMSEITLTPILSILLLGSKNPFHDVNVDKYVRRVCFITYLFNTRYNNPYQHSMVSNLTTFADKNHTNMKLTDRFHRSFG